MDKKVHFQCNLLWVDETEEIEYFSNRVLRLQSVFTKDTSQHFDVLTSFDNKNRISSDNNKYSNAQLSFIYGFSNQGLC